MGSVAAYQASYPSTSVTYSHRIRWGPGGIVRGRVGDTACQKGTARGELQGSRPIILILPILPQLKLSLRPWRCHSHASFIQLFVCATYAIPSRSILKKWKNQIGNYVGWDDGGSIAFLRRIIVEGQGVHDENDGYY